jgi:hypothetical protein
VDVNGILVRQRMSLNWNLILHELQPLLELRETPENLDRLNQLRQQIEESAQ